MLANTVVLCIANHPPATNSPPTNQSKSNHQNNLKTTNQPTNRQVLLCPDKKLPSDNKEHAGLLGYGGAVDAWCVRSTC